MSPNIEYYRVDGKVYLITPFAKKHNKIQLVSPIGKGEYYTHKTLSYDEFLNRECTKIVVNDTTIYNIGCNVIQITNDVYIYDNTNKKIICRYKEDLLHGEYTVITSDYTINCSYNSGLLNGRYIKTSNHTQKCNMMKKSYRPGVLIECNYNNGTLCGDYYSNEDTYMFRYDGGIDECYHHYCDLSNFEQEFWGY